MQKEEGAIVVVRCVRSWWLIVAVVDGWWLVVEVVLGGGNSWCRL